MNYNNYLTVNKVLTNAIDNYNRRPSLKDLVSKHDIETAYAYISLSTHQEQLYEECLRKLYKTDKRLADHLVSAHQRGIEIDVTYYFKNVVNELCNIGEALTREEAENLGIGPNARRLRKEWRQIIRKCHKYLNKSVKNKIRYIKEWSKPRQVYVLNYTGEVHNGLYWTLRELIAHPTYIKYGFKKEEQ